MKRLTERWGEKPYPNLAGKVVCEDKECDSAKSCNDCVHGRIAQRLAAIEDILGDEYELNDLEKALWCKKVVADAFSDNPEATERLRELWFADKDGRCVVFSPGYPVVSTYHKDESGRIIREVAGAVTVEEYEAALKAREQDEQ